MNYKFNCLVIDDEFLGRHIIEEYVNKVEQLNLLGAYQSAIEAIETIKHQKVDIIFIDIEMPDISGIDFVKRMKEKPLVIFVTAYPQYAVQGFEVDAIEYLLKPVAFSRFQKAVDKAVNHLEMMRKAKESVSELSAEEGEFIVVKSNRSNIKLRFNDVYFIEGALEYVSFQTKEKRILGYYSLKNLESILPVDKFMRIHRSYIVALSKIKEIKGNRVIVGEWEIPVSRGFRSELMKRFQ